MDHRGHRVHSRIFIRRPIRAWLVVLIAGLAFSGPGFAAEVDPFLDPFEDKPLESFQKKILPDPHEGFNRRMSRFNDGFYYKVLRPAASTYKSVMPRTGRKALRNFFMNLFEPVYFLNSVLQGRPNDAAASVKRFVVNSTVGVGGLGRPIKIKDETQKRSFDQTFAKWGVAPGPYIVWPVLGSSSIRGTLGFAAEGAMDPFSYTSATAASGAAVGETVNEASFQIGAYEDLKKYSIDLYAALKDIYEKKIYKKSQE